MTFSAMKKNYSDFAKKLADKSASSGPRRILTERSNFVLGAEAMPAPVHGKSFRI